MACGLRYWCEIKVADRVVSDAKVTALPSGIYPAAQPLVGRLVTLEPIDPERHLTELFAASHEDDAARRIWTYLPIGPFSHAAQFKAWLQDCADSTDHVFFAIRDSETGRASGMASYLDIQPAMGVIEIGYIWFAPAIQQTRQATEALFLMLCYALDELRYRRMQWRCNAFNEKPR